MSTYKKSIMVILAVVVSLSIGCATQYARYYSSAEECYSRGSYDRAVEDCVDSLREKPDYEKSVLLLKKTAPLAYNKHMEKAERYEESQKWDKAYHEYVHINKLVETVSSIPGDYPVVDVTEQKDSVAKKAAEKHYQNGLSYMKEEYGCAADEFRDSCTFIPDYKDSKALETEARYQEGISLMKKGKNKQAVYQLRRCKMLTPAYKDINALLDKAEKQAIVKVAIMPFENRSGKMWLQDIGALLTDQLISNCMNRKPEFVEFVTRDYLNQIIKEQKVSISGVIDQTTAVETGELLGIDLFVFGKINSIIVDYPPVKTQTEEVECNIRDVNAATGKSTTRKASAKVTRYTKQGNVTVQASYQIVDVKKGIIVKSNSLSQKENDKVEWARYTGEKKALAYDDEKLVEKDESEPRPAEVLINDAIKGLSKDIAGEIISYSE